MILPLGVGGWGPGVRGCDLGVSTQEKGKRINSFKDEGHNY